MKTAGILCEFNPFHNGHEALIRHARQTHEAVVCVMSGNLVQRGDIAVFDRFTRAEMALLCGADLVVELPVGWSMAGAEQFALGGMSLLCDCGVDSVFCGVTTDDVALLQEAADALDSPAFSENLKKYLADGNTFAKARESALSAVSQCQSDFLKDSNNILAIEYLRALRRLNASAVLVPYKRLGTQHDAEAPNGPYASGSFLRGCLLKGESYSKWVPKDIWPLCKERPTADINRLSNAFLFALRSKGPDDFQRLPDISEGLQNRLYKAIRTADSYEALLHAVKTKRYPLARIRRLVLAAALGLTNTYMGKRPPYLRVLGFNDVGERMIKDIAGKQPLPLLINARQCLSLTGFAKQVFTEQCRADDMTALAYSPILPCGSDLTAMPIRPQRCS